jgi:hypothetical protein
VEVPVTVTSAGVGTIAGAVYKPEDVTVPQDPPVHPVPDTDHLTPLFDAPVTWAVNCCDFPTMSATEPGFTDTVTPGRAIVTVAEPTSVVLNIEIAETVTVAGLGAVEGAT